VERYGNPYTKHCNRTYELQTKIMCIEINFQHSRLATGNLRRIFGEDSTDILCIQEPHKIQAKLLAYQKSTKFLHEEKQEIMHL
jgi:hypothetical protein